MLNLQIISHCQQKLYLSTHPSKDLWFITDYSKGGKTLRCKDLDEANDLFLARSKELLDMKYWDCYNKK